MAQQRRLRADKRPALHLSGAAIVAILVSPEFADPVSAFVSPKTSSSPPVDVRGMPKIPQQIVSARRVSTLHANSDDDNGINVNDVDAAKYFESKNDFTIEDDDRNTWISADETYEKYSTDEDWEEMLAKRADGSVWSSFESSDGGEGKDDDKVSAAAGTFEDGGEEAWLDTLASITAEEIEFNLMEADRADKARQMQEWGFDKDTISSTLGVATDESLETDEDNKVFETFKEVTKESGFGMYLEDEIDPQTVESHTTVERDEETGELIRTQMVYVDEVTCIGCTNCAMIAQSTFFMDSEYGRARVFNQWGDDDETIQVAIETCPVDCIHYVPYDELVKLEIERRDQTINFKSRLVNQGEYGGDGGHRTGGAVTFSAPQKISGNAGARCNNCPTRGCANCPMYGVGENPEFKKKEAARKARRARKLLQEKLENENKSAEL